MTSPRELLWVHPKNWLELPRPGTTIHVLLDKDGGQSEPVGHADVYEGARVLLRLIQDTQDGRDAAALLREDMIDAVVVAREGKNPDPKIRLCQLPPYE
jgi:hypothetical protein